MTQMDMAMALVKENIKGTRKGYDEQNYIHSIRVYEALKKSNLHPDIQLAGLLHDILEDSNITEKDLIEMGYSDYVIGLIKACTHDDSIKDSYVKWETMMNKISETNNEDALIIKIADLTDNMKYCHLLKRDRFETFINKKAPYIVELVKKQLDDTIFESSSLKAAFFNEWNHQRLSQ